MTILKKNLLIALSVFSLLGLTTQVPNVEAKQNTKAISPMAITLDWTAAFTRTDTSVVEDTFVLTSQKRVTGTVTYQYLEGTAKPSFTYVLFRVTPRTGGGTIATRTNYSDSVVGKKDSNNTEDIDLGNVPAGTYELHIEKNNSGVSGMSQGYIKF